MVKNESLTGGQLLIPPDIAEDDPDEEGLVNNNGGGGDDDIGCLCRHERARRVFEKNLESEGLVLEHEPSENNGLNFVKITAPMTVLKRYAEILKLKLPMKKVKSMEFIKHILSKETYFKY